MNTFRFRGKTEQCKWVEGDLITAIGGKTSINTNTGCLFHVIPSTVGLISSMPDSTGKLISQGDMIKIKGRRHKYQVDYDGIAFTIADYDGVINNYSSSEITIVGTIHD